MSRRQSDKGSRRSRAREQALQLLFICDFVDGESEPPRHVDVMDDIVLEPYANDLFEGIFERRETIDRAIEDASENWSLSRMALTDRAILRIAVFEMLYCDDVPPGVSINEAVELAQRFGGEDDSYRFVNGVLGKVALQMGEAIDEQEEEESE